jgi:glucose-6-phosphate 1-dehydrogenase
MQLSLYGTAVLAFLLLTSARRVVTASREMEEEITLKPFGQPKSSLTIIGFSGNNGLRSHGLLSAVAELNCGKFDSADGQTMRVFGTGSKTREFVESKVEEINEDFVNGVFKKDAECILPDLWKQISYVQTARARSITENIEAILDELKQWDEGVGVRIFYLSIPPSLFARWSTTIKRLHQEEEGVKLRIVIEKPFGTDLESARSLQRELLESGLKETAADGTTEIYRIDHYVGKPIVQALPYLRERHPSLQKGLNSKNFQHVRVVQHEARNVGNRVDFFDGVGQVRDMVQSHLLQVMALAAVGNEQELGAAKLNVLKKTTLASDRNVFGQYDGYLASQGLSFKENYSVMTYAALELHVATERWKDATFHIETGKGLDARYAEVRYEAADGCALVFRIQGHRPDEAPDIQPENVLLENRKACSEDVLKMANDLKKKNTTAVYVTPAQDREVLRDFAGLCVSCGTYSAYAILLNHAYHGNHNQYLDMRQIEEQWRIVEGVLDQRPEEVQTYKECNTAAFAAASEKREEPPCPALGETLAEVIARDYACSPANKARCQEGAVDWNSEQTFYRSKCPGECVPSA